MSIGWGMGSGGVGMTAGQLGHWDNFKMFEHRNILSMPCIKKVGYTIIAYFVWMPARQFGTFYNRVVGL